MNFFKFIFIIFILFSCSSNDRFISSNKQVIITDTTAIFDPNNEIKSWIPTKKETNLALNKIYLYLLNAKTNDKHNMIDIILRDKNNYCVQFIGIIRNNKKIIFCNFFPANNEDHMKIWKSNRIVVFDGGCSYWNIEYNVENNECDNIWINGI